MLAAVFIATARYHGAAIAKKISSARTGPTQAATALPGADFAEPRRTRTASITRKLTIVASGIAMHAGPLIMNPTPAKRPASIQCMIRRVGAVRAE